MTFKKKSDAAANSEVQVEGSVSETPAPAPAAKKVVKPCSIASQSAGDAYALYFGNNVQQVNSVKTNQFGGIVVEFKDRISGKIRVINLNQEGLIDVLKFGLEAISQNHE